MMHDACMQAAYKVLEMTSNTRQIMSRERHLSPQLAGWTLLKYSNQTSLRNKHKAPAPYRRLLITRSAADVGGALNFDKRQRLI